MGLTVQLTYFRNHFFFLLASYGEYQNDSKAFLFSLVNKPGWAPVKLVQTGYYSYRGYSVYFYYDKGPTFGGGYDIFISAPSSYRKSSSDLGYTYRPPSGYWYWSSTFTRTFLAGTDRFDPSEVETFYETT